MVGVAYTPARTTPFAIARIRGRAGLKYSLHVTRAGAQNISEITEAQASAAIEQAVQKARELKTKMDIAVVDTGANLKAFRRMDDAWIGSIDIAIRKARTARFFNMATGEIGKLSQPGGPLYGIEHSNTGLISFPGGVVLKNSSGESLGEIGVSGSSVEHDHAVAEAGAKAVR